MAQVNAGRVRFVGRGEYNNSTQYYVFDLISYNGNSYYAKVDTIGNLPTNTTYWQLVAEKGNVGPTGLTGNGISSITKTSTTGLVDTYTITYTNGNTTTFNVSNGNGIDRIEKTATVGNKDTYTIYFTNGSTTTYEVSNGEVTREELEEEVDRLSMIYNAFPSTTGEVEEGSINDTANVPMRIELGASELTQETSLYNGTIEQGTLTNGEVSTANDRIRTKDFIEVLPNTSLPISFSGVTDYVVVEYGSNKAFITQTAWLSSGTDFEVPTGVYFIKLIFKGNGDITPSSISNLKVGNVPNPSYPQNIHTITGDNEVKVEGKNLFNKSNINLINNYYVDSTGKIVAGSYNKFNWVILQPNTTYTLSQLKKSPVTIRIALFDTQPEVNATGTILGTFATADGIIQTFTTTNNGIYLGWVYCNTNSLGGYTEQEMIDSIQIEYGNQPSTYTPYQSQTYPINLGSMELCKIGDYQDVIKRSSGKNLFSTKYKTSDNLTTYTRIDDNSYSFISSGAWKGVTFTIPCEKNTDYFFNYKESWTYSGNIETYCIVTGVQTGTTLMGKYFGYFETFNTGENTSITINVSNGNHDGLTSGTISNIQLEKGTLSTPYEPYGKVWYKYGAIGKVVLNGSEPYWSKNTATSLTNAYLCSESFINRLPRGSSLCNYLKTIQALAEGTGLFSGGSINFCFASSDFDTVEKVKTWVSSHNLIVYYALNTPTITEITDTTLIEQLDNLEKAYSYDTQTNISQTNQDKPFIISYEAILSLRNVLNS